MTEPTRPDDARTRAAGYVAIESAMAAEDAAPLPPVTGEGKVPVVVNAAIWTAAGFAALQAARFLFSLLLTRLVEKSVYGIIATANLYYYGLHMFSDLGVRQCVVNSERGDDRTFLNTAWTVQVLRGLLLWAVSFAICWPIAAYYREPRYLWLVPLLGASALFDGLASTAALTMSRRLRRDRIVVRELAAYIASTAVMVCWLLILKLTADPESRLEGPQLLAFAAGSLLGNVIDSLLSYTYIWGERNRFAWDPDSARELLHFGGWIFVSTACTYLANNFDRLFVSKISDETMADYTVASQLARLPTLLVIALGHQLMFPMYCRLLRAGVSLRQSLPDVHTAMVGLAGWQIAGAFAALPTLIRLVYPSKFGAAADYVTWLCIGSWFTVLQTSSEIVLLSQGQTRQMAVGQIVKLVLLVPALFVGYHFDGVRGVAIGYATAEAARYLVLAVALARQGLPVIRIDLALSALVFASAVIARMIGPGFEGSRLGLDSWLGPDTRASVRNVVEYTPRFVVEAAVVSLCFAVGTGLWWLRRGKIFMDIVRHPG